MKSLRQTLRHPFASGPAGGRGDATPGERPRRPFRRRRRGSRGEVPSEVKATILLLIVTVTINGMAVWGILSARHEARRLALQELTLQTDAHARALEAVLATLRGDFIFLSYSPPLTRAPTAAGSPDPVKRRWSRLAIEAAVILFLDAHPSVERLQVQAGPDAVVVAAGRREGYPVLLPPRGELTANPRGAARMVRVSWPLGSARGEEGGTIEALIDPMRLLAAAAPGLEGRLSLDTGGGGDGSSRLQGSSLVVTTPVVDDRWDPPIAWTLERREDGDRLTRSIEDLAGRYRNTVALNLAVMTLTALLGFVAFREVRRATRAEAESRHQATCASSSASFATPSACPAWAGCPPASPTRSTTRSRGCATTSRCSRRTSRDGADDDAAAQVPRLREGIDRVAGIVHQVLRFGDPGRSPSEPVDLDRVVRDTVALVQADRTYREVEIRSDLGLGAEATVLGDPTGLRQLVLNLLLNACQDPADSQFRRRSNLRRSDRRTRPPSRPSSRPSSRPLGGPALVEVRTERRDEQAVLVVEDRGPGFSDEVRDHLFEPFFSTRGSTGLGLSVVHGIVAEHGGTIRAENRAGGGARVIVEIPLDRPEGVGTMS